MDTEKAVAKIVKSIEACQKEKGFVLISEDWGNNKKDNAKCACALGCLLLQNKKELGSDAPEDAKDLLGVSIFWVEAFMAGFDETPWTADWLLAEDEEKKELVKVNQEGIRIKEQFKPMKYHVFHGAFIKDQE